MSEFKGTKGEWILDERECRIVLKSKSDINDICDVWGFNADTKQSVKTKMIANAKLISCAHEMLEMLEDVLYAYDMGTLEYVNFESIKTLIKKATE